ncbi:MAG: glutamate--tRNA ligase [Nitrospiria bacterium]
MSAPDASSPAPSPSVRVRFAPSPTGFLHVGGARTALFNWLFARHHGGKFFLRIEDTDRSRSTDAAIEAILDGLTWLGLDWDAWEKSPGPGPVRQTERLALYQFKARQLLDEGKAYRCYCPAEELDARRKAALARGEVPKYDGRCRAVAEADESRPFALRFKTPQEGETVVDDLVKGRIVFENRQLDDLIILRSDQSPTYNFCVVVDDVDMAITHVIRGDDHLNNTPRQIQLYRALDFPLPRFGHLSMILGSDKARLSKRHGATSVQTYRDMGYLPEALVNYLVRLGWSHGDQEVFTREELIAKFSLDNLTASAAVFSLEKLQWLNATYLKTVEPKSIAPLVQDLLAKRGAGDAASPGRIEEVFLAHRERSKTLVDIADAVMMYVPGQRVIDAEAEKKFLTAPALPALGRVHTLLRDAPFTKDAHEHLFATLMTETGQKMATLAQPLRVALTGRSVSPGIYDVLRLLGKDEALARIESAIRLIEGGSTAHAPS